MDLLHSLLSNLWSVFLVVFFFGSSIFVHELGHFLAARRRGVIVERFSIGMGPAMFRWRGKDGVDYWLSWLPLGGYVKLPQLADLRGIEGDSSVDLSKVPAPSYSTKLLVFVAGAVFNVLFAFLLATILWAAGMPSSELNSDTRIGYVLPTIELPDGTRQPSPAAKAQLLPGDLILKIDGQSVTDWTEVRTGLALGSRRTADGRDRLVNLQVQRGAETLDISINPVLAGDEKVRQIGIIHASDLLLGQVAPDSLAARLGLRQGDRIVGMDTEKLYSPFQLSSYIETHSSVPVKLQVERGAQTVTIEVPPQKDASALFAGVEPDSRVVLVHENPVSQIRQMLDNTFKSLGSLINPRSDVGISNMTGPIGIVRGFWEAANTEYPLRVALWFTILINISLAVFNLLPIPVLDGGQIVFATIGKLRGRALPPDFINATQSVFVVLLFSMIIYVSYYDVRRIIRDRPEPIKEAPARQP